jgi:DNA-binding HxlR family transcriptional regulator
MSSSISEAGRSYHQFCGLARALDLVGERWALLVVRELALGPKRFSDLLEGLPGVSTSVLSARLRELERGEVVRRRFLPPPAASMAYELTENGRELEPAILALGRWGARLLGTRTGEQAFRSDWLVLALKAFFHPEAARGVNAVYEVRLGEGAFALRVRKRAVEIGPAPVAQPTLVLEADDDALVALLLGTSADGVRVVGGDPAEHERFVELFRFAS